MSAGESMKDMLNEVNGRRLRVDHPSHIVDTFEGIALLLSFSHEFAKQENTI